jgi:hypothetical protein
MTAVALLPLKGCVSNVPTFAAVDADPPAGELCKMRCACTGEFWMDPQMFAIVTLLLGVGCRAVAHRHSGVIVVHATLQVLRDCILRLRAHSCGAHELDASILDITHVVFMQLMSPTT